MKNDVDVDRKVNKRKLQRNCLEIKHSQTGVSK